MKWKPGEFVTAFALASAIVGTLAALSYPKLVNATPQPVEHKTHTLKGPTNG